MSTSPIQYKPIEVDFVSYGFRHVQLKRSGDVAIFKKTALKGPIRSKDVDSGYEVVRIRRHDGYTLGTAQIEPSEVYPSNSSWGIDGFTCYGIVNAEKHFDRLLHTAK